MYEEPESPPVNLIPVLWRFKWHALLAGTVLCLLASGVIFSLPPIYQSAGKVLVETQQIPDDLVKSTVTTEAAERIEVIRQRVMTRDKLVNIIKKYPYFEYSEESPLEAAKLLNSVRRNIQIDIIEGVTRNRRGKNAIAFNVSFESENPYIAQSVANDLVTLFLSENLKIRTERASETTDFLKLEAEKIKRELETTEAAIAKFKQENKDALPEHLNIYIDMRERSSTRLSDLNRDIRATEEKIDQLELILSQGAANSSSGADGGVPKITLLRQQLSNALLKFTPEHPEVIELKRQIEQLEASGADSQIVASEGVVQQRALTHPEMIELRSQLRSLMSEKKVVTAKLEDMERRILAIPQAERALVSLARENELKEEQYNLLVTKARTAQIAESLEDGRKAERFSIIEPPLTPVDPIKPNRIKLLLAGIIFSYGAPIGLLGLIGFLNKNIIGLRSLTLVTDLPVMAVFPYVYTEAELARRKQKDQKILLAILFVAVVAVGCFHVLYMPLNELFTKIMLRL